MPSAQGIRAGRAFVELFADDSKLVRGLRAAEKKLKAFGNSIRNLGLKMMAVGAAVVAPLAASGKYFSDYGDSIAKMAKRTGLSVEALSELDFAAGQSGTSLESLEKGVRKMQKTLVDAVAGSKEAVDSLADLGLTVQDLADLSPEQQFKLLADRISKVEDPTRRAAIAMSIFGKSGTELIPLMAQGAAGIEALQTEARRLGLTMSGEDAVAAEELNDALDQLWRVVRMGVFQVGAALAPALKQVAQTVTRVVVSFNTWLKQNRQVVVIVAKVALAVVAAGAALIVLGTIISGLGSVIGVLITVITSVGSVFGVIGSVIAFLVTPIGAVIAALVALGAYMVWASGAGGKVLAWLGERFVQLRDDAIESFGAISNALAAGDLPAAARVLWALLQMEWQRGINWIEEKWLNFKDGLIAVFYDAEHGIIAVWENLQAALVSAFIETAATLDRIWTRFEAGYRNMVESLAGWLAKRWFEVQGVFDSSLDVDAAKKSIDQQVEQTKRQIEKDKQSSLGDTEQQRKDRLALADQQHQQNVNANDAEHAKAIADLQNKHNQSLADSADKLKQATDEYHAAIEAAKNAKSPNVNSKLPGVPALPDIGDMLDKAAKISVAGTFNASALFGLGTGNAADRTAKATEETAKNTKTLINKLDYGGSAFA
ncbi:MAG: phage tail tape measure protein [Phycisphaerales bacterium]